MHYIIIGGSIAGITAAKTIRNKDNQAEITIISEEKTGPYYRPMIPLLIEKEEMDIEYTEDLIDKYKINLIHDRATGVAVQEKEVMLNSGERLKFDKLLIATGSSPIIPDIQGIKGSDVFTLRTMEDALKIKAAAADIKKAAVIGGGFVGIKAAIALSSLGIAVTIIEQLRQILFQRLDQRGSEIISQALMNEGIKILTDSAVSKIIHNGDKIAVKLVSDSIIDTDLVILAAGVRPDIDIFKDSEIKTGRGILVGEMLETNIPDIYAAGDVVEFRDLLTGMSSVSALWTNAEEMGRIAGSNMAGGEIKSQGFLSVMSAAGIVDIPIISVGIIAPEEKGYEIIVDDNPDSYSRLVFKGDLLAGALFIGDVRNAGIYTNLIKNKIPIGELKEEAIKGDLQYINFIRTAPAQTLAV